LLPATNQPDGQITQKSVHPFAQKYSARAVGQISDLTPRVSPNEGRLAIVTNVRWDAVDAECAKTNAHDADGEVVWS
jgi:hypothetical protein